jgi:hypothetical protein
MHPGNDRAACFVLAAKSRSATDAEQSQQKLKRQAEL